MRGVILTLAAGLILSAPMGAADVDVTGAWKLNRELSTPQARAGGRDDDGRGGVARPGAQAVARRGGAGGGIGGFGGRGGMGGGSAPKEEELRKVEAVRRRMSEVPERLIITRSGDVITITDDFGRSYTLKADGKKQERVTGDGEFKSKTRFEAAKLIVEEDFGGPKVTTTYTPTLVGGEIRRLEISLSPAAELAGHTIHRRPEAATTKIPVAISESASALDAAELQYAAKLFHPDSSGGYVLDGTVETPFEYPGVDEVRLSAGRQPSGRARRGAPGRAHGGSSPQRAVGGNGEHRAPAEIPGCAGDARCRRVCRGDCEQWRARVGTGASPQRLARRRRDIAGARNLRVALAHLVEPCSA